MALGRLRARAVQPWSRPHFSTSAPNSVPVSASSDMRKWVQEQGGFVWSGVHIANENAPGAGLGLTATQPLSSGSTIVALPRHIPLPMPRPSSGAEHVLFELAQLIPEELWSLRLGLKLLMERAKTGSFWWPYISMLPQSFDLPIFFSGPEIQGLEYVPIIHQVKKRCRFLLQFATEMSENIKSLPNEKHPFGGQSVDAGALGWAMAAVSSRAFRTGGPNSLGSAMMLPLIDMCNHSFLPNACIVNDNMGAKDDMFLKVITKKELNVGEAIHLDYGPLSNDFLLLDYGFVIPNNPHDRIELRYDGWLLDNARLVAGLQHSDSVSFTAPAPWQQEALKQLNLLGTGEALKVTLGSDQVDGRLLAALRILYAESATDLHQDMNTLKSWGASAPLGADNERKVLKTLSALAAIVLSHFKTTIAEDENALSNQELSSHNRLVVLFRLTKKQLLVGVMNNIKSKLKALAKESLL